MARGLTYRLHVYVSLDVVAVPDVVHAWKFVSHGNKEGVGSGGRIARFFDSQPPTPLRLMPSQAGTAELRRRFLWTHSP